MAEATPTIEGDVFALRPPSPLCDSEGAVCAVSDDGPPEPIALHYGSPGREERALSEGRAVSDFSDREILQLTGTDRHTLLNAVTTQKCDNIQAGQSSELLVLSPHGHIDNHAGVYEDGDATWLICDAGYGQAMADFLTSMRFMMRVDITPRPDIAALAAYTDFPDDALAAGGMAKPLVWVDSWPHVFPSGAHYGIDDARHPARHTQLRVLLTERARLTDVMQACENAGLQCAGSLAAEAVRVNRYQPRMSREGAASSALPHEMDWLRTAVHLDKGCYRGQETVAKIVNLGRAPRRLTLLYLEGNYGELPASGAPVTWNGRTAGVITTAVRSTDAGAIALALVRRAVPPTDVCEVGEYAASQKIIVSPEGKSSVSPAQRPGAELRNRPQP